MEVLKRALSKPTLWMLVAFFIVAAIPRYTSIFESTKQISLSPVSSLLDVMPDSSNSNYDKLINQNELLKIEIEKKNKQIDDYQKLLRNIENLNATFPSDKKYTTIPAEVLMGFDLSEWRYSISVNKGFNHGIKIGYPVTVGDALVGRVVAVGLNSSRVQLIVDPGFPGVKAIVINKHKNIGYNVENNVSHGYLVGSARKSYMLALEHIPLTDSTAQKDEVYVSNQSFMFPGGLLIGSVENIRREGDPKFYRIDVKPAFDPKSIENVQIIAYEPKSLLPSETITDSVQAE